MSGDLREGGHYGLEGNANGEILRCEPPRLLGLQWIPPGGGRHDQVEIRLVPEGSDATLLELEHAAVADVFRTDPDTGCYGAASVGRGRCTSEIEATSD
ncbi:SRPBCC domain-containing protein [Saccharopolyspora spinosa]|uniref:Activator of Hsp90 ATPase-like protein n=1 Tax=Saccharopolyspora spinosa TaxID=60894 RepID=A0A2N3Y4P7_SACSN|nr:SRPBCC domain-containing protein [Saccharopolyspora spinosa]PKW17863.1 activator of Hsp90 ATPase-like protein [Saccharopolyspora spinosa]